MRYLRALSLAVLIPIVTACGSTSQKVGDYTLASDATGLVPDTSIKPALLLVRPDAPTLSSYDRFIIDPVRIRYEDPSVQKISDSDLARMQTYFRNQVVNELRAVGKTITNQPGESTMRISFVLSGIAAPSAAPNAAGVLIGVAPSVGEVTIEASFSDAASGRTDAIVVDRSRGSRALNATPWSTWADIENSFDNWAKGIAAAVKN